MTNPNNPFDDEFVAFTPSDFEPSQTKVPSQVSDIPTIPPFVGPDYSGLAGAKTEPLDLEAMFKQLNTLSDALLKLASDFDVLQDEMQQRMSMLERVNALAEDGDFVDKLSKIDLGVDPRWIKAVFDKFFHDYKPAD